MIILLPYDSKLLAHVSTHYFVVFGIGLVIGLTVFISHYRSIHNVAEPTQQDDSGTSEIPPEVPTPPAKPTATNITRDVPRNAGRIPPAANGAATPFVLPGNQSAAVRTFTTSDPLIFTVDALPAYQNTGLIYKPVSTGSTANTRFLVRVRARLTLYSNPPVAGANFSLGAGYYLNNGTFSRQISEQLPVLNQAGLIAENYEMEGVITISEQNLNTTVPNRTLRITPYFLMLEAIDVGAESVEITVTEM